MATVVDIVEDTEDDERCVSCGKKLSLKSRVVAEIFFRVIVPDTKGRNRQCVCRVVRAINKLTIKAGCTNLMNHINLMHPDYVERYEEAIHTNEGNIAYNYISL